MIVKLSTYTFATAYTPIAYGDYVYLFHSQIVLRSAINDMSKWVKLDNPFKLSDTEFLYLISKFNDAGLLFNVYDSKDSTTYYYKSDLNFSKTEKILLPDSIPDCYFYNNLKGWAFIKNSYPGHKSSYNKNLILKTIDGGTTWFKQIETTYNIYNFSGITFYNENIGFAHGFGSLPVYTNNGGDSWMLISPQSLGVETIGAIVDVAFFDENNMLLMTSNSYSLLHSRTAGSFELIEALSCKSSDT